MLTADSSNIGKFIQYAKFLVQSLTARNQKDIRSPCCPLQGKWSEAINLIKDLKRCWNEELNAYYEMMEQRIYDLKTDEPLNWDGIYRATSK
jgi:hypothetical protein